MYQSTQEFIQYSNNIRETKKIEGKIKEVQKKFDDLVKTIQTRELLLTLIGMGGALSAPPTLYCV